MFTTRRRLLAAGLALPATLRPAGAFAQAGWAPLPLLQRPRNRPRQVPVDALDRDRVGDED